MKYFEEHFEQSNGRGVCLICGENAHKKIKITKSQAETILNRYYIDAEICLKTAGVYRCVCKNIIVTKTTEG